MMLKVQKLACIEALIGNTKKNALPFQRIVKRTSATTQYDKFNNLRIKGIDIKNAKDKNEQEICSKKDEFDKRIDSFHINFPNIKISATSDYFLTLSRFIHAS